MKRVRARVRVCVCMRACVHALLFNEASRLPNKGDSSRRTPGAFQTAPSASPAVILTHKRDAH